MPDDSDALTNALQTLTAVLQTFQSNPTADPAEAAPAAHVNILYAFESVNTFYLGPRSGSYAFAKASASLNETWDGTIKKFPSFIISLRFCASKVHWNSPAPQDILDISGSNLLTDYHILTNIQVYNASTALVNPCDIQKRTRHVFMLEVENLWRFEIDPLL